MFLVQRPIWDIIHQCVLPKGRSFTANWDTKVAILLKGRSSTTNSWTKVAVLLGMNRCSSFPLLSAPHSLFSIWTDLRWSEKIPGAPSWRWGEWIWLTGPSGLHWNSPKGQMSVISEFLTRSEIRITLKQYYLAKPEKWGVTHVHGWKLKHSILTIMFAWNKQIFSFSSSTH